uniref:VP n=1 Tax=uncultured densovirus TaxID=748192 RepID=A0A7M4CBJ0_9VIRU|nr:VP [uncultured densovirus]
MVRRYSPNLDPYSNPEFRQRAGESAGRWRSRATFIWDQWNRNRQSSNLPRVDPPASLNINTTFRPPLAGGVRPSNASISYRQWRRNPNAGPLLDSFNRVPAVTPNPNNAGGSVPGRINSPDTIDRLISEADADAANAGTSGSKRPHDSDDSGEVGTPPSKMPNTRSGAGGSSSMDVDAPSASSPSGRTGKNSGADGGFDSAQGPETMIQKGGYSHSGGHKTYTKVHHLKSFAIPFQNLLVGTTPNDVKYTTTPLAEIPWDKMFLYMSEDEFKLIPAGSHVASCKVSIQNIVSSTQHPVGGTVASTATFNHPKIGVLGFDLEKCARGGRTLEATMSAAAEMIPTALEVPDYDDFIAKQYGTDQSSATWDTDDLPGTMFPIPYNLYKYFCVYQPSFAKAAAQGYTAANAFGYENFNSCITQFNLNDRTWDTIFEREYSFTSAPIGAPFKAVEIQDATLIQPVGGSSYYNMQRNISDFGVGGDATISETITPSIASKVPLVTYKGRIEQGANVSTGDASRKPSRQPTIHFGMKAIPKLSSLTNGTRASQFVHAEVLFVVTATMTIVTNSFPNRFIKPKANTVSVENFVGGTGRRALAEAGAENVTFGLGNSTVFV